MMFLLIFIFSFSAEFAEAKAKTKAKHSRKAKVQKEKYPQPAELVLDDGVSISVFPTEGLNWKMAESCDLGDDACKKIQAVAWPSNSADVKIIGPNKKSRTIDPFTGEEITEEYSHIEVTYTYESPSGRVIEKTASGWVESDFVRKKKKAHEKENPSDPIVSIDAPKTVPAKIKNNDCGCDPPPIEKKDKNEFHKLKRAIEVSAYDKQVEMLMEKVGQCIKPNLDEDSESGKLNYDLFVLPRLKKESVPKIEKMVGNDTVPMTREDLINIDALARTLYAEVAVCFKKGLQHPLAVSKVIDNRLNSGSPAFIPEKHDPSAPKLTQIVTGPSQFNVWMSTHEKINADKTTVTIPNPALKNALCPLEEKYKKMDLSKRKTIPYQVSIWKDAVRIATEYVLHQHAYAARFEKVNDKDKPMNDKMLHYTSHLSEFFKYKRIHPTIQGHTLHKNGCVQLWVKPPQKKSKN